MALEGDLSVFQLPEILQMIALQQKTGILTVQGEADIIAISFLKGQVVAADALNQTVEEGLGQVLASQGMLRPEVFQQALTEHQAGGERLVDLLLNRRLLTRTQVLSALRLQTYRLLLQVLGWQEGEFKFYTGEEVSYEEGFSAISVEELLLRAAKDLGSDSTFSGVLPHMFVSYEKVAVSRPVKILGQDGDDSSADPQAFWILPDEKRLLERLDGKASASAVAEKIGLGEYQVLYGLYRLLRVGLVKPAAEQPKSPAAVAAAAEARPASAPAAAHAPAPTSAAALPPMAPLLAPLPATEFEAAPLPGEIGVPGLPIRLAALFALAACAAVLFLRPDAFLQPFPWQASQRAAFEKQERMATYLKIDRAARTHFLLEGRYPDDLHQLVTLGLLAPRDLLDPRARPLDYGAQAMSYTLQPRGDDDVVELGTTEGITGDLLLDPELLRVEEVSKVPPLVLLD